MGGFDAVDQRYEALYQRAVAVLEPDPRVRAVELSGSIASGTADAWSDLDLHVITEPDTHDAFLADWPTWLAAITPTVFARAPIAPFIINTLTPEGLTFDLAVFPGERPSFAAPAPHYVVGQLSSRRFDDVGEALEYAVAEQLRGLAGPFVSLLQREEHVKHLTGVPHLVGLLTTVFLAETGAHPPAKRWNDAYTDEQRAAVAALPPLSATRDGLLAFGLGLAELLVTRARPQFATYGLTWPTELAAVAAARLRAELDIDAGSWLH